MVAFVSRSNVKVVNRTFIIGETEVPIIDPPYFIVFTGLIVLMLTSGIRQRHPYLTIREKLTVSL
jgi:hypothetical protein